ncbi:MAG: hypothetical protein ACPGKG_06970 [Paracoccaceae bacterium]
MLTSIADEKKIDPAKKAVQSENRARYLKPHLVDLESSKVVINPDGTWMPYTRDGELFLEGTSDLGDAIRLKFGKNEDGSITRTWEVVTGGGLIEVFLNRLRFSNVNNKCFPTIGLRNFHHAGLRDAVVDLMFWDPNGTDTNSNAYTGMSVMFTNLDSAEQNELQGAPIYVRAKKDGLQCNGLKAFVVINQCKLKNGMDCKDIVKVSPFGPVLISKKTSTKEVMDIVLKRDTGNEYIKR